MNIESFIYADKVRAICFRLPGVSEKPCYGTPGFYVGTKLFARIKEEGDVLVVYSSEREGWINKHPEIFFITPHYQNYPYVLVALDKIKAAHLSKIIGHAWRNRASKTLVKQLEQDGKP